MFLQQLTGWAECQTISHINTQPTQPAKRKHLQISVLHCKKVFQNISSHQKENQMKLTERLLLLKNSTK